MDRDVAASIADSQGSGKSTDGDEGDSLVLLVAGETHAARVQDWFAVHQKQIQVVAVGKLHLEEPTTVNALLHGMRSGIPVVEISDQDDGCRSWRVAIEVDGLGDAFRPKAIDGRGVSCRIHSGTVVGKSFRDLVAGRGLRIAFPWRGILASAACLRFGSRRAERRRA